MKALIYDDYCDLSGMRIAEMPDPKAGPDDVLVEVHAAGLNPIDWKVRSGQMRGRFELEFPDVAGRDLSGVVIAAGQNVDHLKKGDTVFGTCPPDRWGSHAELVAVAANALGIKPPEISHIEAASISLVGLTALTALEQTANIVAGMKVLIHAGAGGVGSFAIQYAKSRGALVYTTASPTNTEFVENLGADKVIDYRSQDFREVVSNIDIVYDTLGGDTNIRSYDILKSGGLMVCLNAEPVPSEKTREDIRVDTPLVKYDRAGVERIVELIQVGAVRPSVGSVYYLDDAIEAYGLSETNHAQGKVVLQMK